MGKFRQLLWKIIRGTIKIFGKNFGHKHNPYDQGWDLSRFPRENSGEIFFWPGKYFSPELLGLKIFSLSNLPRWCSGKAEASWPPGSQKGAEAPGASAPYMRPAGFLGTDGAFGGRWEV